MGLLEQFGIKNGLTDFIGGHRGAIMGLGTGLANGNTLSQGIGNATQGLQQGAVRDDAFATQQKVDAERVDQINKTAQFLQSKGYTDLLPLVEAGQAGVALTEAFKRMQPQAPQEPWSVSPGETLVDPNTRQPIYTGPAKPDTSSPTLTSIYDPNGREQKGYMNGTEFVPVGSPKAAIERPEFTNAQATAAGYADRMVEADKILDDPKLAAVQTDLGERAKGSIPGIGNMLTSPEYQQAEQAKRNFINAILRRESGAAIAASEFDSANQQYFPQPGDSPAVLANKKANRINAIKGVARSAGPAYESPGASGGDASIDDLVNQYLGQ